MIDKVNLLTQEIILKDELMLSINEDFKQQIQDLTKSQDELTS